MNRIHAITLLAASIGLAGCGGGGGASTQDGSLRLALTDAPACGFEEVNVKVLQVAVHQSAVATDTDSGWQTLTVPATVPQPVNLLSLTNGVLQELGQMPLPAGRYTQLRLVLAETGNSVMREDGSTAALTTPSGQQSGVKVNVNIEITPGRMADFVVDFDACKSVVTAGRSGRYLLKPQLAVTPRYVNGVQGFVDPALANGQVTASLQQDGTVIRATPTDATGRFLLQPVAPGNYTLVISGPGRATMIVTGVPVVAENVTAINTADTALAPPVSATAQVTGTVTTGSVPVLATVRALQTLASGNVEIAGAPVDGDTGGFAQSLAVAAPSVAAYALPPAALNFSLATAAAGKYTLEASDGSATKSAGPFTLTSGSTLNQNFVLP